MVECSPVGEFLACELGIWSTVVAETLLLCVVGTLKDYANDSSLEVGSCLLNGFACMGSSPLLLYLWDCGPWREVIWVYVVEVMVT